MKLAYFVNEYPKVSHSFIRREILALERQGFEITRFALRGWAGTLPDPDDLHERAQTHYVLKGGLAGLILPTLREFARGPIGFCRAVATALRAARDAERPAIYHLVYLGEACHLVGWLRVSQAARIHAHFGTNSAEVVMLARALGGPPYSFTVHGPDEFHRNWALEDKVRRSDFVVAISLFGRSQLFLRTNPEDWHKVKVVHCGLEKAFYNLPTTPIPVDARLVCVGRLCAAKGQLLLVEAVARIAAEGIGISLVLAGDGPMRNAIEKRIAQLGMEAHIRITGWIGSDQVRSEILSARALVLPSFAEGLPVVLMEAMALRRPVLTTSIAGIPELVKPGENGWMFPAGSADAIVHAMRECLSCSPEVLQKMGDAGFAQVTADHNIELEAAKLAVLFRSERSGVDTT